MSTRGDTLEVSSSSDDELDNQCLPSARDATRSKPRIHDMSTHSRGATFVGTQAGRSWICRWCVAACVLVYGFCGRSTMLTKIQILFYKRDLILR